MEITFIRHAETEFNRKNLFCGISDCNITDEGKKQAQNLKNEFSKFDFYYCSPLKRTEQTLKAIFPCSVPIIDNRIIEISLGSWEGLSKTSINQQLRKEFKNGNFTPEGAENNESVEKRIISFLKDMFSTYTTDEKILVVTHNGVLRTLSHLLEIQPISKNLDYFTINSVDCKTLFKAKN